MRSLSVQKLLALSLIVFLSGTCCLLCCDLTKVAAAFGTAESCPLSKSHHCPRSAKQEVSTAGAFTSSVEQTRTFCPFISKRGDAVQNVKGDLKFTAVSVVKIAAPPVLFVEPAFTADRASNSFIRDRGGTYLTNCAFRI
ncbi:MAG TPA: hypothetical protein VGO50_03805 [Pyrinomonadaceae bacterium]|jgi:hypothetical protein|nr:hypothetical protein [Pyrinomonadaceae bacterium]